MCVYVPLTSLFEVVELSCSCSQLLEASHTRSRDYIESTDGYETTKEKVTKAAPVFDL
jgi:hypothetical protein